jgi:hypothetical protein
MPIPRFLIDRILPSRRIHLLAGISSAGKSRFIVPTFKALERGLPVLGLATRPVPWALICADRPLEDAEDTIASLGYKPDDVNIIPAFGKHNKSHWAIMEEVKKQGIKLILWEGFDFMVKNPNNPYEVREFLGNMSSHCEDDGLTIVGTVGVAKLKPHEIYQNPRQLVAGSSLWERATSTDLIIQAVNPKDIADPRRILYVSLKNSPSFSVEGCFDEKGILVFRDWTTSGLADTSEKAKFQ